MPGVVLVVPQGAALPGRGRREEDAAPLAVIDEEIASPVEKTLGTQGLDDQTLDLGFRPAPVLPGVDALGSLHGHRDLFLQSVAQHGFGARMHEVQVVDGGSHLGAKALFLLALEASLKAQQGFLVFREGDPQEACAERQGQGEDDEQRPHQVVAGQSPVGDG